MSNFPNDLQTELTRMMKLLDEAGLCAEQNDVHPTTRHGAAALKAVSEAQWDFLAKLKAWQVAHNFAPDKLAPVLSYVGQAADAMLSAHVQCLKIAHDKGIKVFEGGGK